ncbi:hypothetical protein A2686_01875 [Candidatus Woesebacteria bacterium RIFCSPHIGHO2_01_FULL_38_10]|uniref:Soluble ligand binding domain-containing protein n=1 Tax=Candidatus Woesebacteria bacterium RIFCSPLOWO2_01_FULL_39_10b TaxID=1802517 RepID=A0A1F8B728_9BACT|nr:MAG: hypothetical protein A2686_01875 [Candidatus Woesebacteria bacterium RIFCSPHIGHO2_01_FULL_38_10]OGM59842.1 MAG: hypothetical protein A2892_00895 [Candidatus Woesebacteria bacterium RIFCSPLOWO2_01_FULL_39_10b]
MEKFFYRNRFFLSIFLIGAIFLALGIFYLKRGNNFSKIEVLETSLGSQSDVHELIVEISGAVENPGVYKLGNLSRVEDLLIAAGGLSAEADRVWVEKMINRAGKLTDGQKIYIPEHSDSASANFTSGSEAILGGGSQEAGELININSASQKQLESLPGIGPVYAQNIIEQRPYSSVEELLSKGILKKYVYEKIKDKVTVY